MQTETVDTGTWLFVPGDVAALTGQVTVRDDGTVELHTVDADGTDHAATDLPSIAAAVLGFNQDAYAGTQVVVEATVLDTLVWKCTPVEGYGGAFPDLSQQVAVSIGILGVQVPGPSDRLWEACLLIAMRNAKVTDAPLGVAGGFDLGQIYVGNIDSDLARLMRGYLGVGVPTGQAFPDLDDLKQRLQVTGTADDAFLQRALDAAVDEVHSSTAGAFGVA